MKKHLLLLVFISYTSVMYGQTTEFIHPESNQTDWSIAGVEGGIPDYENIVNAADLGAVGDDDFDNTAVVQSAIDSLPAGTILFFPPGSYLFKATLYMKSGVVIRGSAFDETTLSFELGESGDCISFKNGEGANGPSVEVTAGLTKDSKEITVASSFDIGDYIVLAQENDPELMYTQSKWNVSWAKRSVGQVVRITGKEGNKLGLQYPLTYNYDYNLDPLASSFQPISFAGIENLKVHRRDSNEGYNISMYGAANCWVRNIETSYAVRSHLYISRSTNIEIRDSYFHHARDYGGGGHGYGVDIIFQTSATLVENNIFHYLRHSYLCKNGATANVFAYNYSREPNGSNNDIALHGHYSYMLLLEGNIAQKMVSGDWWGPQGIGITYFRNRVETSDIRIQDHSHYQNIMANELVKGTVSIDGSVQNTWRHSNVKKNVGNLDGIYTDTLPNSLYLDSKPDFFGTNPWPPIGPETPFVNTIPAKQRWDDSSLPLVEDLDGDFSFEDGHEQGEEGQLVDDAYVRSGQYANDNFAYDLLFLKSSNSPTSNYNREVFLKFDISQYTKKIDSARLRLYIHSANTDPSSAHWNLYKVEDDSWAENTVVWSNRPASSGLIDDIPGQGSGYVEFDISSLISDGEIADKSLSFAIIASGGSSKSDVRFHSKETGGSAELPTLVFIERQEQDTLSLDSLLSTIGVGDLIGGRTEEGVEIADSLSQADQQLYGSGHNQLGEDLPGNTLIVYPNPSGSRIIISGIKDEVDIDIVDMQGKVVKKLNNYHSDREIDVRSLKDGVYILRFYDYRLPKNMRFIKQ